MAAKVTDLGATWPVQGARAGNLRPLNQKLRNWKKNCRLQSVAHAKLERLLNKCKLEPVTTEHTDVAQLWLGRDMLLHPVKTISSEKCGLESELRVFEPVIQRLPTNQVQATPAPPSGPFGNHGSPEPTSGHFGTRTSAEPTPGLSGSRVFSVKSSNPPTYEGKRTLDDVTAFLFALERHCKTAARAIGWVGTMGCGAQAVLHLKGDAAVWAMHRLRMSTAIE